MLHGPQRGVFNLQFAVPSACAEQVRNGESDIGIVPIATLLEQDLTIFRGTGIACRGSVRTILLISKIPFAGIDALAVDSGSRTSVLLSRIVLRSAHRANPSLITMEPRLRPMLEAADAALIIGDAALLLEPDQLRSQGLYVADLGAEWTRLAGLPMVFAVWAGRAEVYSASNEAAFLDSCHFGLDHIDDIVRLEHSRRGITPQLARQYLSDNLVLELGENEYRGMDTFLQAAAELPPVQYIQLAETASEKRTL